MYVTKIGYGTRRDYDNSVIIMIIEHDSMVKLIKFNFYQRII